MSTPPIRTYTPPTTEEINALPEHVRLFICDLETRADPAGDVRRIAALREQVAGLEAMAKAVEDERTRCAAIAYRQVQCEDDLASTILRFILFPDEERDGAWIEAWNESE